MTHEGFSNRQTWSVALAIDNNDKLAVRVLQLIVGKTEPEAIAALKIFCGLHRFKITKTDPDAWKRRAYSPIEVNWKDLIEHYKARLEDLVKWEAKQRESIK